MSDEIHKDLYKRLNQNTSELSRLTGKVEVLVEQNDKLYKTIRMVIYMMFFVILALIFTLIYGAIGDRGLKAVRDSIPHVPMTSTTTHPPAPWVDDLRRFFG